MTTEEKLLHFQEDAMLTARQKSSRELDEFSKSLQSSYEAHCLQAKKQARSRIQLAKEDLRRKHNREVSKKQLELKRAITLARDAVTTEVLSRIMDMINTYKSTEAYMNSLVESSNEARSIANGQAFIIFVDKSDEALIPELKKRTGCTVRVSDDNLIGGIEALIQSKNILVDLSYASRLREAKKNLIPGGIQ